MACFHRAEVATDGSLAMESQSMHQFDEDTGSILRRPAPRNR